MAFAAALPPDGGDDGQWNSAVLAVLAARPDLEVHAFADRPVGAAIEQAAFGSEGRPAGRELLAPNGVPVHPLAALEAVEGLDGEFDAVIYVIADDIDHTGCLAALRRRSDGVVVARSVTLAGLYENAARSGGLAGGLAGTIATIYGDAVNPGVGARDTLPAGEAGRLGLALTRDVLAHCRRLVVTRPSDAALADLDAAAADRAKIRLAAEDPAVVADALYEEIFTRRSPA